VSGGRRAGSNGNDPVEKCFVGKSKSKAYGVWDASIRPHDEVVHSRQKENRSNHRLRRDA
jgi:hypothetical protein